jgi:glycosyltransferase involved in cell wall biosynthesis/predicted O-methyltransferase YrrM
MITVMNTNSDNFGNIKRSVGGIEGWLTDDEGKFLYYAARNCTGKGVIVEIGSWKGKSTVFIGKGSESAGKIKIYAIDPHIEGTYEEFKKNIKKAELNNIVIPVVKTSEEAAEDFTEPVEFIFIDGDHEYEKVKQDLELWFPKLINKGIIAFHDTVAWPGPRKVVKKQIYTSRYFKNVGFVDSITFAQKIIKNSLKDRLRNRSLLFLRNRYVLFLKNRFHKRPFFLFRYEELPPRILKILHVIHSSELSGPQRHLLDIAKSIDRDRFSMEVACPEGWLSKELEKNNVRTYSIALKDGFSINSLLSLFRIARKGSYDIIHAHMGRTGLYAKLVGVLTGKPVILTEHLVAHDHSWIKNPVKKRLHLIGHKLSNRMAKLIIAVSEVARDAYIERQGVSPDKIITMYNFVDTDLFVEEEKTKKIRKELGIGRDNLVVGFLGRLDWSKGLRTVIDTADGLKGIKFLIVGDGDAREELRDEIKRKGIERDFILTGLRKDVPAIMKAMDIFVFPTTAPYESFGIVVIEAMAAGLPVIASDIGPVREIINDSENGILVPMKDPAALRSAIKRLIKDQDLMKRLGEEGRRTCLERFSLEKAINKIEAIYEKILDR